MAMENPPNSKTSIRILFTQTFLLVAPVINKFLLLIKSVKNAQATVDYTYRNDVIL